MYVWAMSMLDAMSDAMQGDVAPHARARAQTISFRVRIPSRIVCRLLRNTSHRRVCGICRHAFVADIDKFVASEFASTLRGLHHRHVQRQRHRRCDRHAGSHFVDICLRHMSGFICIRHLYTCRISELSSDSHGWIEPISVQPTSRRFVNTSFVIACFACYRVIVIVCFGLQEAFAYGAVRRWISDIIRLLQAVADRIDKIAD